jgi:hypothetical protein
MLSWDKTYLEAKEIKEKRRKPSAEFQKLREYIFQEFDVKILNGDIYEEPVFKHLPQKLRIIIEGNDWANKLPVKNDQRKRLIGNAFIDIIEELGISKYPELEKGELNVQYLSYTELRFEEVKKKIPMSRIKDQIGDRDIVKIHSFGNTYYVFYPNRKVLKRVKQEKIQEKIIDVIKREGYNGKLLDKIKVVMDEIGSLEKAGNLYNYLR